MLINLAQEMFEAAGWDPEVKTGREAWKVGSGARNVHTHTTTKI